MTSVYFADKLHINEFGRPIFGEDYQADRYGPIGTAVYGLLTGSPLAQLAPGSNGALPFRVDEAWGVTADRKANGRMLSASDIGALTRALDMVKGLSFDELVEVTQDDPAYREADGGRSRYEDMLAKGDPEYEIRVENLAESARHAAF